MRRSLHFLLSLLLCLPLMASAAETGTPAPCTGCMFAAETAALQKLLVQYRQLAEKGGWPAWAVGRKITPRQSDARIPALRSILTAMGDYDGADRTSIRYDDALATAVKRFQLRHGLNPDATIGKGTQAALAVPVETRILAINKTIERVRSRPLAQEPRYVLVNLPAFTLTAVENGTTSLTMRVIIGDRKNHTPLFDNAISDVVFNPEWRVPGRIARNELLPRLRADPEYFTHAGFVVTKDGRPVDPQHLPEGDDFSFRQIAGEENALGRIKFDMTDPYNIYLHSTSAPKLFTKDDRALSHGCIRVEDPLALAHFVMDGTKGWDGERIDAAYGSDRHRWVAVDAVPVHLVYWTAFADANGVAHFYGDIYNKDSDISASRDTESPVSLAAK